MACDTVVSLMAFGNTLECAILHADDADFYFLLALQKIANRKTNRTSVDIHIIPYPQELPSEGAENVSSNDPAYNLSDSEGSLSGDEDHEGYEPLSQDPDNYIENSSDIEEDGNFLNDEDNMISEVNLINHALLFPTKPEESFSLKSEGEPRKNLKLDQEKIDTIKSVMKGIQLPQSNLPDWATVVPEEEWKSVLLSDMLAKPRGAPKATIGENSLQNDTDYGNDIQR